jgi:2-polyprenyl-6-methoxyphenol hydroxylase-like FAD-dependent oxidoreductase
MTEVLIVGAGPVGLTMALACQKQGLSIRLIDKLAAPSGLSKALTVWSGTMEMLDGLDVAGAFLGQGITSQGLTISRGRRVLVEITGSQVVDSLFPLTILLPQAETERILTGAFESRGGIVEREIELDSLATGEAGVEVRLKRADGTIENAGFRWVIGCDGAHSTVRHLLGIQFDGVAIEEPFVLCDARIEGAIDEATAQIYWSGSGPLAVFPVIRGVWRLIATRSKSGVEGDPTLEEMQALVDERGPGGWKLSDPTWLSVFRISERMVDRYRCGRVFLAGDAAHVHSPAGGQGMNLGMQDAANLAWKLAIASGGRGEAAGVLDSYQAERLPVAEKVLNDSGRLIRASVGGNRVLDYIRDSAVRVASHFAGLKKRMVGELSGLEIQYPEGTLVASDEAWEEDWRPHGFIPGTRPRDAVVYFGQEPVSLFKMWPPPLFTLLLFSGRKPIYRDVDRLDAVRLVGEGWEDLLRVVQVWCGDQPPPGQWLMDPRGAAHRKFGVELPAFYLIRPDQYVALRSQPAEAGVLQTWLGKAFGEFRAVAAEG